VGPAAAQVHGLIPRTGFRRGSQSSSGAADAEYAGRYGSLGNSAASAGLGRTDAGRTGRDELAE